MSICITKIRNKLIFLKTLNISSLRNKNLLDVSYNLAVMVHVFGSARLGLTVLRLIAVVLFFCSVVTRCVASYSTDKPTLLVLEPSETKAVYSVQTENGIVRANPELVKEFVDQLVVALQAALQKTNRFEIKDREFLDAIQDEKKKMLLGDIPLDANYAQELGVNYFARIKLANFEYISGFDTTLRCKVQVALADSRGVIIGKTIEIIDRAKGALLDPIDPTNSGDKRYSDMFARLAEKVVKEFPTDAMLNARPVGASTPGKTYTLNEGFSKAKYMVLLGGTSTRGDEVSGPAADEISGALAAAGLRVADKDISIQLHDEVIREIQKKAPSEAFLNRLHQTYGADFVVMGTVTTETAGALGTANPIAVAQLNVRLIRTKDAAIMFSGNDTARGQDPAITIGMRLAAANAGKQVADKVLIRMKTAPSDVAEPDAGEEYNLTIRGVASFQVATKLTKALEGVKNVISIERTGFTNGELKLRLVVKKKSSDAVFSDMSENAAVRASLGNMKLSVIAVNDNNVEVTIVKN